MAIYLLLQFLLLFTGLSGARSLYSCLWCSIHKDKRFVFWYLTCYYFCERWSEFFLKPSPDSYDLYHNWNWKFFLLEFVNESLVSVTLQVWYDQARHVLWQQSPEANNRRSAKMLSFEERQKLLLHQPSSPQHSTGSHHPRWATSFTENNWCTYA